ncbi:hypothetical protein ACS0PU_004637 [Formica fusca]
MAVRHYAHQYTMRLTDEKNTDANVSSENSDMEDYYPLIHHTMNSTIVEVNARRRGKGTGWNETIPNALKSSLRISMQRQEHVKFRLSVKSLSPLPAFSSDRHGGAAPLVVLQRLLITGRSC